MDSAECAVSDYQLFYLEKNGAEVVYREWDLLMAELLKYKEVRDLEVQVEFVQFMSQMAYF